MAREILWSKWESAGHYKVSKQTNIQFENKFLQYSGGHKLDVIAEAGTYIARGNITLSNDNTKMAQKRDWNIKIFL